MEQKAIFVAAVAACSSNGIRLETFVSHDKDGADNWVRTLKNSFEGETLPNTDGKLRFDNVRSSVERVGIDPDELEDFERTYRVTVERMQTATQTFEVQAESEEEAQVDAIRQSENDDWEDYAIDVDCEDHDVIEIELA